MKRAADALGNYNLHFCTDINSSVSRIIDHAFVNWTFPDLLLHHVDGSFLLCVSLTF